MESVSSQKDILVSKNFILNWMVFFGLGYKFYYGGI